MRACRRAGRPRGAVRRRTRAHPAGAAGPQLRALGWKDPTSKDVANAVWWLFKGIVITFVVFVALRNRWVRDWLTSPEYNEATGLRRRYIEDGGGPVESKAKMSVGEAIYMVGVFAIDALLTLGVAALIFYAVVS